MLQRISSILCACVILIGFAVPISVALDNLLLALVLLGMLLYLPAIWRIAVEHPVARAAMLLFGMLFLAMFYGVTPLREALDMLAKYLDLAFLPMFMLMLSQGTAAERAQQSFLAAMGLTLLLSYLLGLGWLAPQSWMYSGGLVDNPSIFHSHITQNNMMAFAVFLALLHARDAEIRQVRLLWGAFALLGTVNILFMLQGRTGYLILFVLFGWFVWTTLERRMRSVNKKWGWRQGVGVVLAGILVATALYQFSPRLHDRVEQVRAEYQAWQPNGGANNSTGLRLDFYYNSLQIVLQHPLLGVGAGGFSAAYAEQAQDGGSEPTGNPHNEYLLIATQTGLIGLALLLYLFWTVWRNVSQLESALMQDAARGLVLAYMINGAFNSALHDHGDGLFFAFMAAALFAGQVRHG